MAVFEQKLDFNDDEFNDDPDFDDEFGDAIDEDDAWGSDFDADDQPMIIHDEFNANKNAKPVIGINDENPFGEGDQVQVEDGGKPQIENKKAEKCWVCEKCNAINNLLLTNTIYNFKCALCNNPCPLKTPIIFSEQWDNKPSDQNNKYEEPEEEIYTVWRCAFCTLQNDINWAKCDGCDQPKGNLAEIAYSYTKPRKQNAVGSNVRYNPNDHHWLKYQQAAQKNDQKPIKPQKNKPHKPPKPRKPRIENIGIARKYDEYPSKIQNIDYQEALTQIFGPPFRNKLLAKTHKNTWAMDCNLAHSHIKLNSYSDAPTKFSKEPIVERGFAINQKNGWIATMSANYIWVFEPIGFSEFKMIARYNLNEEQRLKDEDITNSRIRYHNDCIFVWSFARSRILCFKLYEKTSLMLVDSIKDAYFKRSKTMDIAVTDNLLILLFSKWCGVYKRYPKFKWYHAVAFAEKSVNCFSFEMQSFNEEYIELSKASSNRSKRSNKKVEMIEENKEEIDDDFLRQSNENYMFVNTENQIIGSHPSNQTFDFLHVAKDTVNGKCKFCVSKKYGCFYLSNDGKEIYVSSHLEYQNVEKILSLNDDKIAADKYFAIEQFHDSMLRKGIEKFCNLRYDEGYGVSGRLLLFCQTKKNSFIMHCMFNQNELFPFAEELNRIEYILMPGMKKKQFNLIIYVYEMLYGTDLVDTLLQSAHFNPALSKLQRQEEKVQMEWIKVQQNEEQKMDQEMVEMDIDEYPQEGGL